MQVAIQNAGTLEEVHQIEQALGSVRKPAAVVTSPRDVGMAEYDV